MSGLVEATPVAVLGTIAVTAVSALVWIIKRKNESGDSDRDRIVKSVAYIEEHKIEMPANWREYVEQRILHKRRGDAMQFGILATLLRRGHVNEAAELLEMLEREAKR